MTIELPTHPIYGQALGIRRNGDPIWLIRGGAEEDSTDENTDEDGTDENADEDDKSKEGEDDSQKPVEKKGPDWKSLSRRNETEKKAALAAKRATEAKLAAVLAAIGGDSAGNMTAEQLKSKLAEEGKATQGLLVENAVIKAAVKVGVDPDALTDSRKFMKQLEDLDPKDKNFAKDVQELVEDALESNPRLSLKKDDGDGEDDKSKKKKPAGSSGKQATGAANTQLTREELARMKPADIVKAQNEGRLSAILGKK